MYVSHVELKNWRNFRDVDIDLSPRSFVVGPNASGKSNFLDVFRFLHDIVRTGGGLTEAVRSRGGMKALRCLAAAGMPAGVQIAVHLSDSHSRVLWKYELGFKAGSGKYSAFPVLITHERVTDQAGTPVRVRSEDLGDDARDAELRTQTHLQQVEHNAAFRPLRDFFRDVRYLHLVPQLIRHPQAFSGANLRGDPFGREFLETIARTPDRTKSSRLRRIENVLKLAVPQLKKLTQDKDAAGVPHLQAIYEHWRHRGAVQEETDFSDGTLRLIGLLWCMLEDGELLLLEEPELSLHVGIVERLAPMLHRAQRVRSRQVLISTHSADLLRDSGIAPEEVLVLTPDPKAGTQVTISSQLSDVMAVLASGGSVGDAVIPRTRPERIQQIAQLELFA